MGELVPARNTSLALPAIVSAGGNNVRQRLLEFFASNIRNRDTRRAYSLAVHEFLDWSEDAGVASLIGVRPLHVAAWIEGQTRTPTGEPAQDLA